MRVRLGVVIAGGLGALAVATLASCYVLTKVDGLTGGDAVEVDSGPAVGEEAGCAEGTKSCFGQCVSNLDPAQGCTAAGTCSACEFHHATAACLGGMCGISACEDGFAQCSEDASAGCDTDLSRPETCGSCPANCAQGVNVPFCSPTPQGGFACSANCAAPLTPCGLQCVDLTSNVQRCGGCGTVCPTTANGTAVCQSSKCSTKCNPGFHACTARGSTCENDLDPAHCGPGCLTCPKPANAVPTCVGAACGYTCAVNFGDCDGKTDTGCEANFGNDRANCGKCGMACADGCCGGKCIKAGQSCDFLPDNPTM